MTSPGTTAALLEEQLAAWGQRRAAIERALTELNAGRDDLVCSAIAAGISLNHIHKLTGISRPTIYRIKSANS